MISYTLAKELKDAGFRCAGYGGSLEIDGDIFQIPTLSELIEACPKKHELIDEDAEQPWFSGDFTLQVWLKEDRAWHAGYEHSDGWYEGPEGEGSTPEEAVANLYLKLHKNDSTQD